MKWRDDHDMNLEGRCRGLFQGVRGKRGNISAAIIRDAA